MYLPFVRLMLGWRSRGAGARLGRVPDNNSARCTMADERGKLLESAIAQIEKNYGKGAIMRLGSRDVLVPVSVIPTGAFSIDAALGVGGVPRGRVIEIYGPESGGK